MGRKCVAAGTILLLILLVLTACGIPQEEHDAVIAERDTLARENTTLKANVSGLESEVNTLEADVNELEKEVETSEGKLSDARAQMEGMQDELSGAETLIWDLRDDLALTKGQLSRMEEVFGELLFFDDFEDGDTEGWGSLGTKDSWSVVQEDGNYILQSLGKDGQPAPLHTNGEVETIVDIFIDGAQDWTDYTLECRIRVVPQIYGGAASVNLKNNPYLPDMPYPYSLNIAPNMISLYKRSDSPDAPTLLAGSELEPLLSNWTDMKVEVYGANIKVYVSGALQIDYTDPEPLERARISIGTDLQDAYIYLDDVLVTRRK